MALLVSMIFTACQPTQTEVPAEPSEEEMEEAAEPTEEEMEEPEEPTEEAEEPAELKTVRIGMLPYLDWQPLIAGDELGYFEEEGLEIEVTYFPDDVTVGEAVVSGDVDIGVGNSASAILLHARFPELVRVGFDATWRGTAIMVRAEDVESGKFKTYDQFYEEYLETMSPEEAAEEALADTCAQLEGAEVVMDRGTSTAARLAACFPPAGISYDDIRVVDIQDAEGALAFLSGTGDFEIGGFPQRLSILEQGGMILISGVEMGGASILVSDEYTTQEYLENNYDTVVATRRIWYRVIDEMYSNPDRVLPILADIMSEASGSEFSPDDIWPEPTNLEAIQDEITLWPRLSEVEEFYFDPDSRTYWKPPYEASAEYWVDIAGEVDSEDVNIDALDDEVNNIIDQLLSEQ